MQTKTRLTFIERQRIEFWFRLKVDWREMGRRLGRDHSVIEREVERNKGPDGRYRAGEAQRKADARQRRRRGRKLEKDELLHDHVVSGLQRGLSPEKIAGRLKYWAPAELAGRYVSPESIYDYIYNGQGRFEGLYQCLWYKRGKRRKQCGRKPQKTLIDGKISVWSRPAEALARIIAGFWESDSMVWPGSKPALSVQSERVLLLCRLRKTADRTAEETTEALRRTAETVPAEILRSVTFDNGKENAGHAMLKEEYGVETYFCDPYASWQKPIVENQNRVIRHFWPRKKNFAAVTDREVRELEDRLNNLPRKSLLYLTPNEALQQYLTCGALVT